MKIALFLPNWLGDLVMATPVLRAIRRHFGREACVAGIMRPNLAELLDGTDWLDEKWLFDPRDSRFGGWPLLAAMRRRRPDATVLLSNSLRTALLAWLGGAPERIGYARYGRGPLLTKKLYAQRDAGRLVPEPMVDYYLRLAEALGCAPESPRLELATTAEEEQLGDRIWRSLGLRTDGRVVLLNSSGAYGAAKLWPESHFADLARRVASRLDHDVLVLCGPREQQRARQIAESAAHPRVFSLAEQPLGLPATKACARRGQIMVSTDSGPRHVAAAFGKPVVTLFGPTLPVWSANPTVRSADVRADLPCLGCGKRTCPLGHHRCMNDLSVDAVFGELLRLLKELTSAQAA